MQYAFYPQPGVCTPPGCSPPPGTRPPTAAAPTRRGRAPRAAASPAARSPAAAGRSGGRRSRRGRCSAPLRRSAGRRSPGGYSGRAGTPGGRRPTSSWAGVGQTRHRGGRGERREFTHGHGFEMNGKKLKETKTHCNSSAVEHYFFYVSNMYKYLIDLFLFNLLCALHILLYVPNAG